MKEYIIKVDDSKPYIMGGRPLLDKPQELIRCADCIHWIPGTITDKDDFFHPRCKRNGGGWSSDDYCSCAERREELHE